jgi:hypothetical protein
MATAILSLVLVAALASGAAAAGAFTFEGFARNVPAGPEVPGIQLTAFGIANPPTPGTPNPIPLDFSNYQYTIRVTLNLTSVSGTLATQYNLGYATGSWEILEDASTAANYANLATFVDGTIILSGTISGFNAALQTDVTGLGFGSGIGGYAYTGGTRLAEVQATQPIDCAFQGTVIRDAHPIFNPVPAGFLRTFNVKMFCTDGVADDAQTWGTLKSSY